MVAREGQHSGVVTNPFRYSVPPSAKIRRVFGITSSVPARWSSVRMIRMLGRAAGPGFGEPDESVGPEEPEPVADVATPGSVVVSATPLVHAAARATSATIAALRRRVTRR